MMPGMVVRDGQVYQKARLAYEDRQEGLTWPQVAERLGYEDPNDPWRSAKRYAKRHNLEWPVPMRGTK